jgi:NADH dehydrogenase (ubiquinone) Fe-S protein 3
MLLSNYILNCFSRYIFSVLTYGNHKLHYIYVNSSPLFLHKILIFFFLHYNFQNKLFSDLVGVDFPDKKKRFQLVYNILSVLYHQRVFIQVWSHELEVVPSVISFFPAAHWYEREVWDLFGVHFINNMDLRRILTDYGFQGHPLRKDFPLSGFIELFYNAKVDSIIYREINLIQSHRNYSLSTPWSYISLNTL